MPPGLLWTGVSLMASGGIFLGVGVAQGPTPDTCGYGDMVAVCAPYREVLLTTGGVLAGVGATLLAIGFVKRGAPQITFRPGGFAVQQPVPLDFGIGRLVNRR